MEEFVADQPRIVVIGCGGAGCNTVSRLSEMGIAGATTVACNTDARHLNSISSQKKLLIGKNLTKGLGAGGYPEIGKQAALESKADIKNALEK